MKCQFTSNQCKQKKKKKNAKKVCKQSLTLGHSPSETAEGVTSKAEGLKKRIAI